MDLQLYDHLAAQNSLGAIEKLGTWFAQSGMLGVKSNTQGAVLAMTCIAERISPLEFARTYHIIDGKPSMRADAMQSRFMDKGGKIKWLTYSDTEARAVFGYDGNECEMAFTMDDAKRAGLIRAGSGWEKHPDAMLRARLVSKAIRMICPTVCAGVYTPEEMEDIAHEVKATVVADNSFLPSQEPQPADQEIMASYVEKMGMLSTEQLSSAVKIFRDLKWINEDQTAADISDAQKVRTIDGWDKFLRKVNKGLEVQA